MNNIFKTTFLISPLSILLVVMPLLPPPRALYASLRPDELEGVMAHELAHVKIRDILISTITATLAGGILMIGSPRAA